MNWQQALLPAVVVALAVRAEALLLGPYWAWIELLPALGDDDGTRSERRRAMARRVAIPGIASFAACSIWPATYSEGDAMTIAGLAAGLLLWPAVVHGLPFNVMARNSEVAILWGSLVAAFVSSALLGASAARWIIEDYRNVAGFLRQQALELIFASVVVLFAAGTWSKVASRVSSAEGD